MTKFKTFWRPTEVLNPSFITPLTFTNYFKSARHFSNKMLTHKHFVTIPCSDEVGNKVEIGSFDLFIF